MKTASYINTLNDWRGDARHYKLSEPHQGADHVVVSAVVSKYGIQMPETYIFRSDEDGKVKSFSKLRGSFKGAMDHELALKNAGYAVVG